MTGQKIKDILRSEGITIADVARMLGHNGDQRLHSALKSEDVKSGLIEDIARVTNKSVCYFYEGSGNTVATDHGIAVSGDSNQINALSEKFIACSKKGRADGSAHRDYRKRIINRGRIYENRRDKGVVRAVRIYRQ
ncbi:MAG: hypothetical protein ACLUFM_05830 [Lachnospiraceae bacterium]